MWKTRGTWLSPWRNDLEIGGVQDNDTLFLSMTAKESWEGKLMFDRKRHADFMHMPSDWPRINQFPEYFVPEPDKTYSISGVSRKDITVTGTDLVKGFPVKIKGGRTMKIIIRKV
jgi:hypothetical protein